MAARTCLTGPTALRTGGHVVPFDYAALDAPTARAVRVSAERIRQLLRHTLDDILQIGAELISVKKTLPDGQFRPWLRCELGWKDRSARNFMNVAERFKSARVADLELDVTAAYLLAAPSTPERARILALARAERGEHITYATARRIIAQLKNRRENGEAGHRRPHARQRALKAIGARLFIAPFVWTRTTPTSYWRAASACGERGMQSRSIHSGKPSKGR